MPTHLRKIRRLRGSRTVGYGQVGQHRKSGQRGGRGRAGLHKHKWTWTIKYDPEHFRKDPFKPPKRKNARRWVNVGRLDEIYDKMAESERGREGHSLNLKELGYDRLLGGGEVRGSYKVEVKSFTKGARLKVEGAGGEVITG